MSRRLDCTGTPSGGTAWTFSSGALRYLQGIVSEPAPHPEGGRPLLCFLHGHDEAAPTEIHEALTRHGPLRPDNPAGATAPFIIVAPQLPTGGDIWHRHSGAVGEIVDAALNEYGGDPKRCYLTGFSFGGNGVFDLALLEPDWWAALWAVDPTRVPEKAPGQPIWLSTGAATRRNSDGFIRKMHLLSAASAPAADVLYLDQGGDHVGSARLAYGDPRIYRWLRAHQSCASAPCRATSQAPSPSPRPKRP